MNRYVIYYEPADTDSPRELLGEMKADTIADALDLAAQYYEYPHYALKAVLQSEPAIVRCRYCGNLHQASLVESYPFKPK